MNKLVFIVEDNPAQQKMLQVHFEETLRNYQVKTFSNPDEMMRHLSENPFAIVLDHFFNDSKITGLDYLKDLRKSHKSIPIIYYTTADDEAIRSHAIKLGVEQYIVKDSASLVRLRTALDILEEKHSRRGIFQKLFGG